MSRSNCSVSSVAKRLVLHRQAGLVVQLEGAVVEVDRSHARPRAVHGQRLGVQHRGPVLVQLGARLQQLVVNRPPGGPDDALVDMRAGHQDPQPDAALGRVHQRLEEGRPGHEVGRRQVQGAVGRGDGQVRQRLGIGVAHAGAGAGDLHRHAVLERARCRAGSPRRPAPGRWPRSSSRRTRPGARAPRALHPHVRVAPVVGVLGVAGPLLGDAHAAGHAHPSVGDQQLAVGAVLQPADGVGLERAEAVHASRPRPPSHPAATGPSWPRPGRRSAR